MNDRVAHPLAELIPPMTETEYAELKADIEANGQREPVTLYEGKILDGRHRYRACGELGITPETRAYDGEEPAKFVISLNVHRRQLTTAQRAEIARIALPELQKEAKARQGAHARAAGRDERGHVEPSSRKSPVTRGPSSADRAAELVGVSGSAVERMARIARERPDLHAEVVSGNRSLNAAYEETATPPSVLARKGSRVTPLDVSRTKNRQNAESAKTRVEKAVGNCNAIARGFDALRFDYAIAVATPEEIQGWDKSFNDAIAAIRRARREIQSNQEVANAA